MEGVGTIWRRRWTRVSGQRYLDDGEGVEGCMKMLSFVVALALATAAHADGPRWDESTVSGVHDITGLIVEERPITVRERPITVREWSACERMFEGFAASRKAYFVYRACGDNIDNLSMPP
jgi:hypothetical protein